VVIGGQHIARAVKLLYENQRDREIDERLIKDPLKKVQGEVLAFETPIQLAKMAAGVHQARQDESKSCTTEDVCRLLAREIENKGFRVLSNDELFNVVRTAGKASELRMAVSEKQKKKGDHVVTV
jgi:hypothetical protein